MGNIIENVIKLRVVPFLPERKKAVFIDSFLSQRTRLLFLSCCLCPFSIQKGHRSFLDHIGRCWQFISPQFLKISFVFMVNFEGSKTPEVVDAVGFQPTASKVTTQYGADGRIRTGDLLITNQLLYRLSYTSKLFSRRQSYHIFTPSSTPISSARSHLFKSPKITVCIITSFHAK